MAGTFELAVCHDDDEQPRLTLEREFGITIANLATSSLGMSYRAIRPGRLIIIPNSRY